jgi:hypothetical protein
MQRKHQFFVILLLVIIFILVLHPFASLSTNQPQHQQIERTQNDTSFLHSNTYLNSSLNTYRPEIKNEYNIRLNGLVSNSGIDFPHTLPKPTYSLQQVGILTRVNSTMPEKEPVILPLMARELTTRRGRWNYYSMNDKYHMIQLPVYLKQGNTKRTGTTRNCTDENGCEELFTGDIVSIEGYNEDFKVSIYERNNVMYSPVL